MLKDKVFQNNQELTEQMQDDVANKWVKYLDGNIKKLKEMSGDKGFVTNLPILDEGKDQIVIKPKGFIDKKMFEQLKQERNGKKKKENEEMKVEEEKQTDQNVDQDEYFKELRVVLGIEEPSDQLKHDQIKVKIKDTQNKWSKQQRQQIATYPVSSQTQHRSRAVAKKKKKVYKSKPLDTVIEESNLDISQIDTVRQPEVVQNKVSYSLPLDEEKIDQIKVREEMIHKSPLVRAKKQIEKPEQNVEEMVKTINDQNEKEKPVDVQVKPKKQKKLSLLDKDENELTDQEKEKVQRLKMAKDVVDKFKNNRRDKSKSSQKSKKSKVNNEQEPSKDSNVDKKIPKKEKSRTKQVEEEEKEPQNPEAVSTKQIERKKKKKKSRRDPEY